MALTYESLQTITTTAAASTITFSSISSSFTDLIIIGAGRNNASGYGWAIRFNGDSSSSYSWTDMEGSGSGVGSNRNSTLNSYIYTSYSIVGIGDQQSNMICHINNYGNTSKYKSVLTRINAPTATNYPGLTAAIGTWNNTAAITSITILTTGSYFTDGTTFSLYGIKGA